MHLRYRAIAGAQDAAEAKGVALGSGSLPDRGSVITRSAIWRGGTYLFGDPRNEHVSPPTYLSEGLASVPPIHARNDLRNDKNRDGDSRAAS